MRLSLRFLYRQRSLLFTLFFCLSESLLSQHFFSILAMRAAVMEKSDSLDESFLSTVCAQVEILNAKLHSQYLFRPHISAETQIRCVVFLPFSSSLRKVNAWVRKSEESGLDGMVTMLQTVSASVHFYMRGGSVLDFLAFTSYERLRPSMYIVSNVSARASVGLFCHLFIPWCTVPQYLYLPHGHTRTLSCAYRSCSCTRPWCCPATPPELPPLLWTPQSTPPTPPACLTGCWPAGPR